MQKQNNKPESFSGGVINIFYKNKGSKTHLDNYRPISLLNTDYKILAKILANKIKTVIHQLIGHTQSYSIPGRDITDSIITVKDTIRTMAGGAGVWIGIDLMKAFDRVEHSFLFGILRRFGFGEGLIGWIELLYRDVYSVVKCNGRYTEKVRIGRSIRQGCPLSSLLYSLVAEPLAAMVAEDSLIHGVEVGIGNRVKMVQYADDINFFTSNSQEVSRFITHLEQYQSASGAKVNISKSEITTFGTDTSQAATWGFSRVVNPRKVLGVYIGADEEEADRQSWEGVIKKVERVLNMWRMRGLLVRGKVTIINVLCHSLVTHVLSTTVLPSWAVGRINSLIDGFLWRSKGVCVRHRVMINGVKEGGLKLIDVGVRRDAARIKLVGKYLDGGCEAGWKMYFGDLLRGFGSCGDTNLCVTHTADGLRHLPGFYREVMEAWKKVLPSVNLECVSKQQVHQIPYIHNPAFLFSNRTIYNKSILQANCQSIIHMCNNLGKLDTKTLCRELKLKGVLFRGKIIGEICEKVKRCMKPEWLALLEGPDDEVENNKVVFNMCVGVKIINVCKIKMKTCYDIVIKQIGVTPTANAAWVTVFSNEVEERIWGSIDVRYISPEMFHLDFKLRHRRIFPAVVLHQINNGIDRQCTVCFMEDETIEHIFLNCSMLKMFVVKLRLLLSVKCHFVCNNVHEWNMALLFGVPRMLRVNTGLVNIILSLARRAVFLRRNSAFYDGRYQDVWVLFFCQFKAHFLLFFSKGVDFFQNAFMGGNDLFSIEGGDLLFNLI